MLTPKSVPLTHVFMSYSSVDIIAARMDSVLESKLRKWICVALLTMGGTVVMMDRVTLTGVMVDVQTFFSIGDGYGGALQSVFSLSITFATPIVGYLGDRLNRKWLIWGGVAFSSFQVLLGAFMTNYTGFLMTRIIMGFAQAFTLGNPIKSFFSILKLQTYHKFGC